MNDQPHDAPTPLPKHPSTKPAANSDGQFDDPHTEQPGAASWPGLASAYAAWPDTAPAAPSRIIPPPHQRLDPKARTLWIINGLMGLVAIVAIVIAIIFALHRWRDLSLVWTVGIPLFVTIIGLVLVLGDPILRYRSWHYAIRTDEVDLQHGLITRQRQLVPMARIQHVDTRQGPLERHYGLATVVFFTAAGSMEIPALSVEHAAEVRDQIAALAKVHDDI